ncbi:hypothetical protein CKA32_001249 [Geitlerinema sp. FC II]|nr:hypothetical protein CKA32_001249 [Geitlerinema sp. FC II]
MVCVSSFGGDERLYREYVNHPTPTKHGYGAGLKKPDS